MSAKTVPYTRPPLTRAQRADAAERNLLAFDRRALAGFAADLICHDGGPPPLPPALRHGTGAIRRPRSVAAPWIPDPNFAAINDYLMARAAPSRDEQAFNWIEHVWLRGRLNRHAKMLNDLHPKHPKLYEALFEPTLRRAVRIGRQCGIGRSALESLLADRARFALVAAAHDRIARIRLIATNPYDGRFSGFITWKTAEHVLLSTVAQPARSVQQVYRLASTFVGDDEAVRTKLRKDVLLTDSDAGAFVFQTALDVRAIIIKRNKPLDRARDALRATSGPLEGLARLSPQDIADAGLGRSGMAGLWFQLEAAEIATFVARELLTALNAVDALVKGALDRRTVNQRVAAPSQNQIIFASTLLRAEGKPDRQALQIGNARGADGGIDRGNKGNRRPFATMTEKMRDPEVAKAIAAEFSIDARWLFRR